MISEIDPLTDPRWLALLARSPGASAFHTRGWLEAVYKTYGHKPAALAVSGPDGELLSAVVYCRVLSRITGRRLISLPFSDHCVPIVASASDLESLLATFEEKAGVDNCRYMELRPTSMLPFVGSKWKASENFYLHRLDLRHGAAVAYQNFHRDCVQRRIDHAEKEGVVVTIGRDPDTVKKFHELVLHTRRRHGVPPQPIDWFTNVMDCMGERATIRLAYKAGQAIAGILTLQYATTTFYKYGASEAHFHRLGAMPYLFWHAIQDAIARGHQELDLGRSECDNHGLVTFKERLGAKRSPLVYLRSPAVAAEGFSRRLWKSSIAQTACRYMPNRCLLGLGMLFYRHID